MSNKERAATLLTPNYEHCQHVHNGEGGYPCMFCEYDAETAAERLAEAGLLAPDLPEPNDPAIFVPNGKGWLPCGPDDPSVWTAPDSVIIVQRIEPGNLTPNEARQVAYALLAAADYAEETE